MALCATSPNSPSHHNVHFNSCGRAQLHQRVAYDEALLQTIACMVSSAELTTISASKAVVDAQNALLAAQAWLVTSRAVFDGYRHEQLRLKESVARSRALLRITAACLPDELIMQIASFLVEDGRHGRSDIASSSEASTSSSPQEKMNHWGGTAGRLYPLAMSQVCRRWRIAVLGSPRLWAYQFQLKSQPLANLFGLRAGSCDLDVVWTDSTPSIPLETAFFSQNITRWRSLRAQLSSNSTDPYPFVSMGAHPALSALYLSASSHGKPPVFSTSYLKLMPNLETLDLSNVQLSAPPPFRHQKAIDLTIKYGGVISFRAKDMEDISIVFPNLRRFRLSIRGPYINRVSPPRTPEQTIIPYSFPALEELDISAKDLSHSLSRFQGAYLPRLATLRLRDNGLPVAASFFQHLTRSRAPLSSLTLTDCSLSAIMPFRGSRTVEHLGIEPLKQAVEILRPSPSTPSSSPVSPISPSLAKDSVIAFPKVTRLTISPLPAVPESGKSRHESSLLPYLAQVIRDRNKAIMGTSPPHTRSSSDKEDRVREHADTKAGMMVGFGKAVERPSEGVEQRSEDRATEGGSMPMTSDDTLVNQPVMNSYLTRDLPPLPPPSPPFSSPRSPRSPLRSRSQSVRSIGDYGAGTRKRRLTMSGMAAVPILDVEYTPLRPKGRSAMEEVYSALVDGRMRWKELGMDGW